MKTTLGEAWVAESQLSCHLYLSEIKNKEEYHRDLSNALNRIIYWLNPFLPERMARKHKLRLLFNCYSDIDLYGPLCNCSTEMPESQYKEIRKLIHRTTMINPSKDVQVHMQKKSAALLIDSGLHCFDPKSKNSIKILNHLYSYTDAIE
jgi:hypothetical protein